TRVRQTMRSLSDGHSGTLRVAAMPGPVSLVFPKFIASKLSKYDGISISIQARTSNQIAELTRAQSIDFGFADAANAQNDENLYRSVVISADCPVAMPADHPLTHKAKIQFSDLHDQALGTLPKSHRQSRDLANRFASEGLSLRTTIESQTFLPIFHFVTAGQCCTVVDPLSVYLVTSDKPMVEGIAIRPMERPIRYHYAIYSPRHRPISVVAKNLLASWQEEVLRLLDVAGFNPRLEDGSYDSADNSS
ncbi:MAG: LysR substrate-binding domain-containing protein, partial [Pseudomonadota bacterium]